MFNKPKIFIQNQEFQKDKETKQNERNHLIGIKQLSYVSKFSHLTPKLNNISDFVKRCLAIVERSH